MSILFGIASVALSLWVGGLALFLLVVIPFSFKSFPKEEAGHFLDPLFPAVEWWGLILGGITGVALFFIYLERHFSPESLRIELPVLTAFALTYYVGMVLHPQLRYLKNKIALPEYQKTAHQQSMKHSFDRLHKVSVRLHLVILLLGLFSLGVILFLP